MFVKANDLVVEDKIMLVSENGEHVITDFGIYDVVSTPHTNFIPNVIYCVNRIHRNVSCCLNGDEIVWKMDEQI
jgi:hypothetical protein